MNQGLRMPAALASNAVAVVAFTSMTVLQRTDLTTSQKIQCAAAVLTGQHEHGSKTTLSEAYGISRPTVYAAGAPAESVLRTHFEAPLLQGAAVEVGVDDAQLRRAVVALRVLAPTPWTASANGPPLPWESATARISRLTRAIHFPHSLRLLYSAFTYYTGLKGTCAGPPPHPHIRLTPTP